jgi:hypothetical protein
MPKNIVSKIIHTHLSSLCIWTQIPVFCNSKRERKRHLMSQKLETVFVKIEEINNNVK